MDIPRIFTISESEHRIRQASVYSGKYALDMRFTHEARACAIPRSLGSGSGECSARAFRDYGVIGTGVTPSRSSPL